MVPFHGMGRIHLARGRFDEAVKMFEAGVSRNSAACMRELGTMCFMGWGMPVDVERARRYYIRGAKLGNIWAYRDLSSIYRYKKYGSIRWLQGWMMWLFGFFRITWESIRGDPNNYLE